MMSIAKDIITIFAIDYYISLCYNIIVNVNTDVLSN